MRTDPFFGYTFLVRALLLVVVPAFAALQFIRLRRAFHVFQLESYKRDWFRRWVASNRDRALFLRGFSSAKKPLVMTGRAWRTVITGTVISIVAVLAPAAAAHLLAGAPWDLVTFTTMIAVAFIGAPQILLVTDAAMAPVQRAINARFTSRARARLEQVGPLVIGITGSYGKTSTKVAIARLLAPPDVVLATPASYNTPLGVVRTINEELDPQHRYLVVEMGARREGDIAELCRLVEPRIGVLTSVGSAHLETFGSADAIRRGKYEIVERLPRDGTAVMNVDDPVVRALARATTSVRVVRCGLDPGGDPDVTAADVEVGQRGTSFRLVDRRARSDGVAAQTRLLGRHALVNLLLASAVALEAGRTLDEIARGIGELEPVEHRLQIIEGAGGVTVLDDAYNSNPAGAAAALEVLAAMPARRRVIVTPGMVELGDAQATENERFGAAAARVADTIIVVAPVNRDALLAGAEGAGTGVHVEAVDSLAQATERLRGLLQAGDVVLFENDLPDQYEV